MYLATFDTMLVSSRFPKQVQYDELYRDGKHWLQVLRMSNGLLGDQRELAAIRVADDFIEDTVEGLVLLGQKRGKEAIIDDPS